MDAQLSFSSLDFAGKKKRTKRDVFLAEMMAVVAEDTAGMYVSVLLGVSVRSKPRDLAGPSQPLVHLGLAFEASDVFGFDAGTLCNNLPVILGEALHVECDAGGFCH